MIKHRLGVHEKIKNFNCQFCDKAFFRKKDCLIHEDAVHEKIRYECELCSKIFSRKVLLSIHLKKHLSDQNKVQHS